jgi:L-arabinose isomerase
MLINEIFYNRKSKNTKKLMKQKRRVFFLAFETTMNVINPWKFVVESTNTKQIKQCELTLKKFTQCKSNNNNKQLSHEIFQQINECITYEIFLHTFKMIKLWTMNDYWWYVA